MMRLYWFLLLILSSLPWMAEGDTLHISKNQYNSLDRIILSRSQYWQFRPGADSVNLFDWDKSDDWIKMSPISDKEAFIDANNYLEGWFRILLEPDSTLKDEILFLDIICEHGAYDVYYDKQYQYSIGKTGRLDTIFQEAKTRYDDKLYPWNFEIDQPQQISIFLRMKQPNKIIRFFLRNSSSTYFLIALAKNADRLPAISQKITSDTSSTAYGITYLLILILFSTLWWKVDRDRTYGLISLFAIPLILLATLSFLFDSMTGYNQTQSVIIRIIDYISGYFLGAIMIQLSYVLVFPKKKLPITYVVLFTSISAVLEFISGKDIPIFLLIVQILCTSFLIYHRKKLSGAKKYILYGVLATMLFGAIAFTILVLNLKIAAPLSTLLALLFMACFPIGLLLYLTTRISEILKEVKTKAEVIIKVNEEKRIQTEQMNVKLEKEVQARTSELSQSLENLKATQTQLIQSEKMASLGELTAGIAHEIQNPLNFVNNFSEVSSELLDELTEELTQGNTEEIRHIANDLKNNLTKITQHGERASSIVRSMLQHSRNGTGIKEPTDINALCDECTRLAFHGMRAKDKSFQAKYQLDLDESLPEIDLVPQDLNRVLLNIISNAFYAVAQKEKEGIPGYEPLVIVRTQRNSDSIRIMIIDNGSGIPEELKDKIFQPFFTTKPAGSGTGLGLSLSYDIIQGYNGTIQLESNPGKGSQFLIKIPIGK